MAVSIRAGIKLYQDITLQTEQKIVENMWVVDDFYRYQLGKEVITK